MRILCIKFIHSFFGTYLVMHLLEGDDEKELLNYSLKRIKLSYIE